MLLLDGEALVIDKPAGLPVDPPRRGGMSVSSLAQTWRFGFMRPPTPVHRLDQDTSGCLLLARNPAAHRRFSAGFATGAARKFYLAITDGTPSREDGVIDLPLAKISSAEKGWRMHSDPAGKTARTRWRCLDAQKGQALLALWPETGRTHQLRVHLASGLGCPIHGDPVYGARARHGLTLHAAALHLDRADKPAIAAHAPWPARFAAFGFAEPSAERLMALSLGSDPGANP